MNLISIKMPHEKWSHWVARTRKICCKRIFACLQFVIVELRHYKCKANGSEMAFDEFLRQKNLIRGFSSMAKLSFFSPWDFSNKLSTNGKFFALTLRGGLLEMQFNLRCETSSASTDDKHFFRASLSTARNDFAIVFYVISRVRLGELVSGRTQQCFNRNWNPQKFN